MTRLWRWSVRNYRASIALELLEEVDHFRQSLMGGVPRPSNASCDHQSRLFDTGEPLRVTHVDEVRELYNLIEVESDRLTRLVSNLLDITRIEAGVFTVHPNPTSVRDLVREAVNAMKPTWRPPRRLHRASVTAAVNVDSLLIGQV